MAEPDPGREVDSMLPSRRPSETSAGPESRRSSAGFFSSAKSFFLPIGQALDPAGVGGYPIDLRVKARSSTWPPGNLAGLTKHYVALAQYGLGAHERWVTGQGEQWLQVALGAGDHLLATQESDGSWVHHEPFEHTFPLPAPWRCGMAQGEAASLLVRLYLATGESRFADSARAALVPLSVPTARGGVLAELDGAPWPEEYPTDPPSYVLNGAIFALWGLRDVGVGLSDSEALRAFNEGVDGLAASLHRFDNGWWSLYCLFPLPVAPISSSFYHALHIAQLDAMNALAPRPEFKVIRSRWAAYAESPYSRRRAFLTKAAFRIAIPRNRLFARRMPWTRI
jgi:heparosan-N-sulfate-glucuronate 5-epimerase